MDYITQTGPYSREVVRQMFTDQGITISAWAQQHGFRREDVYAVLSGRLKGKHGLSHEIAVALGLKPKPSDQNTLFLCKDKIGNQ
ncbi:MAG: DNA-binding protein [Sedimenticola sp.]|nr:MAG: DNA-binding protein [Sedimenticola sp.]